MYIVIAGAGLVGGNLAKSLVENHHDVVIVERDKAVCEMFASKVGVLAINGTATDIELLEQAGIRKADVAVAAMPADADNLAFALLAHHFEVPRIIARMRDPRYEAAYRIAGVTRTLNLADLFVRQLVLDIEQPALRQVANFGDGKAFIVVVVIPDGARVRGKTVMEIDQHKDFPRECVIAGIYREETKNFIFPRGDIDVRAGDQVFLAADADNVRKGAEFLQRTK